jgi:hypothetical protein
MDAAAQREVARWNPAQAIDVTAEMSALTPDVVGRALFGTDLVTEAPPLGRSLAAGQRLALLGAFLPIPSGPASTRVVRRAARPFGAGRIQEQVEQLIARRLQRSPATAAGTDDRRNGASLRGLLGLLPAARDSDGSARDREGDAVRFGDHVVAWSPAGHDGRHRGTVSDCDEVAVPVHRFAA